MTHFLGNNGISDDIANFLFNFADVNIIQNEGYFITAGFKHCIRNDVLRRHRCRKVIPVKEVCVFFCGTFNRLNCLTELNGNGAEYFLFVHIR